MLTFFKPAAGKMWTKCEICATIFLKYSVEGKEGSTNETEKSHGVIAGILPGDTVTDAL